MTTGIPVTKIAYTESKEFLNFSLRKPSLKYLDQFVDLKCAPDLLLQKLFPNAKEITESMAAFEAFRKYIGFRDEFKVENNGGIFVVGDGCTPRTGALFAFRTLYNVWSIDPAFRKAKYRNFNIDRLYLVPGKIEENEINAKFNKIVIVCVHSHALISECVKAIDFKHAYIISIPCCIPDDVDKMLGITLVKSYEDWGIHSEKRMVNIYECIK